MEVEGVVADTPSLIALLSIGYLVSLTVDAGLHDMVPADGTVVNVDVPGPECHSVPFFDFEPLGRCYFNHISFIKIYKLQLYFSLN